MIVFTVPWQTGFEPNRPCQVAAGVDDSCVAHYRGGDEAQCFFAQYVAPFVETPLFAL